VGTSRGEQCAADRGDIVDLLQARNAQIRSAFQAVAAAQGPDRAALVDRLVTHLAVHQAVTQELVRPLVERHRPPEGADWPERPGWTEIMGRLSRLVDLGVDDKDFVAQLLGLARIVTLHTDAQERIDLPLLRRAVPEAELRDLADLLISAENVAWSGALAIQAEVPRPDALELADVQAALAEMVHRTQ
jgi:hypothetical protein